MRRSISAVRFRCSRRPRTHCLPGNRPISCFAVIDDDIIAAVLVREFPDTAVVYRFGSTVDDSARPQSDIDLAFLPDRPVEAARRFAVQEMLAARLHRDVDLVDLASASTVMRMQVVSRGKAVATIDQTRRDVFEDYVFSSYARLNEERRAILDRIAREGRVHGG